MGLPHTLLLAIATIALLLTTVRWGGRFTIAVGAVTIAVVLGGTVSGSAVGALFAVGWSWGAIG